MSANDTDNETEAARSSETAGARPEADRTATDADGTDDRTDADAKRPDDRLGLAEQVDLLADENQRLREEYVRARQSRYRSTAIGLAIVGLVAIGGGLAFPDAREVLIALGATGAFGALLTYYLTPSQFVAADIGERVYTAAADNVAAIADDLGLQDERIYVPGETDPARLYVPQHAAYTAPDPGTRSGPIVVDPDARGLLLTATGAELFREFERGRTGERATDPAVLAGQLLDALVEQFELVRSADRNVDTDTGRVTVAITGCAFGDVDRFDHPVPSFLAVGFAASLERRITLEVTPADGRADWLITCRWGDDAASDSPLASAVSTADDSETLQFDTR